jgi:hypothetical protein
MSEPKNLVARGRAAREFDVSLINWERAMWPGFANPIIINGRKFFDRDELERAKSPPPTPTNGNFK